MAGKTVTRVDLAKGISRKQRGLSNDDCRDLLEQVLDRVIEALVRGETVKIKNFATFRVHQKSARIGRNPKTGVEAPISPRRVIKFRASEKLKHQVNHSGDVSPRQRY